MREGGIPTVLTFGGPPPYKIRHIAQVPYLEEPSDRSRWVRMDQRFLNDLVPAMAQGGVQIAWQHAESLRTVLWELESLLGMPAAATGEEILRTALHQLRSGVHSGQP